MTTKDSLRVPFRTQTRTVLTSSPCTGNWPRRWAVWPAPG